jgi:hypothetical protein
MRVDRLGSRISPTLALHLSQQNPTCSRHRAAGPGLEGSRESRHSRRVPSLPTLSAIRIAAPLATPFIPQLTDGLSALVRSGGEMLLKIACVLLIAWLLGVLGLYRIGDLVHVLLLVGLMLLLLGGLKARDAATARGTDGGSGKS